MKSNLHILNTDSTNQWIKEKIERVDTTGGTGGPGEPPMDTYNKAEIDAKFKEMLAEIKIGFTGIETKFIELERKFHAVDTGVTNLAAKVSILANDMSWVKWLVGGTFLMLLGSIVKVVFYR